MSVAGSGCERYSMSQDQRTKLEPKKKEDHRGLRAWDLIRHLILRVHIYVENKLNIEVLSEY